MSKQTGSESLLDRIKRLTLQKINTQSAVRATREAANKAEHLSTIDPFERRIVLDAKRFAEQEAAAIDAELSAARAERRLEELVAQLPPRQRRLETATQIVASRNRRAERVQTMLEDVSEELRAMDLEREQLLMLEKEVDSAVFAPHIFANGNSRSRLVVPLAGCLGGTSYEGAVRRSLLAPAEESFAELEKEAGRRLIERLRNHIAEIEALTRSKKGAA